MLREVSWWREGPGRLGAKEAAHGVVAGVAADIVEVMAVLVGRVHENVGT